LRRELVDVVIRRLPVNLGDFKCLESIEHVLKDAHDGFEQLPLVRISLRLLNSGKRIVCVNRS
jgi:hypothetical protein